MSWSNTCVSSPFRESTCIVTKMVVYYTMRNGKIKNKIRNKQAQNHAWVSPIVAGLGCVSPASIGFRGTDRFSICLIKSKDILTGIVWVCVVLRWFLPMLFVHWCCVELTHCKIKQENETGAHPHSWPLQELAKIPVELRLHRMGKKSFHIKL